MSDSYYATIIHGFEASSHVGGEPLWDWVDNNARRKRLPNGNRAVIRAFGEDGAYVVGVEVCGIKDFTRGLPYTEVTSIDPGPAVLEELYRLRQKLVEASGCDDSAEIMVYLIGEVM